MPRLRLVPILLAAVSAALAGGDAQVTVVFVRHAETAGSTKDGGDPPLSEPGRSRAAALARTLADSGVTHLFTSEALRCRETLAPLGAARGLEPTAIPARETERQVAALRALPPGSFAVVAGHSNTIPAMVGALGGKMGGLDGAAIPHEDYGRMIVVVLAGGGGAATVELRYGKSPAKPIQAHTTP